MFVNRSRALSATGAHYFDLTHCRRHPHRVIAPVTQYDLRRWRAREADRARSLRATERAGAVNQMNVGRRAASAASRRCGSRQRQRGPSRCADQRADKIFSGNDHLYRPNNCIKEFSRAESDLKCETRRTEIIPVPSEPTTDEGRHVKTRLPLSDSSLIEGCTWESEIRD
jgi:hypothetical protein